MKTLFYLVFILGLVCSKQWFHDVKATSLTSDTFDKFVGHDNHVIIEFFTPWCGYCQQMAGEWNKLFTYYDEQLETRKDVKIAKLNCDDYQALCHSQEVRSFPAILLYVAGQKKAKTIYQGYRRFDDFKNWIENNVPEYVPVEMSAEQKQQYEQQKLEQKQREEEERRRQHEEIIRLREEAVERQHAEEILRLQKEEALRQQREVEEKIKAENEERLRRYQQQQREDEEQKKRKTEEEHQKNQSNMQNEQEQIKKQQDAQIISSASESQIAFIRSVTEKILNELMEQKRNTRKEQLSEVLATATNMKVQLDYAVQKINILDEHQKHNKDLVQTILTELHQLKAELHAIKETKQNDSHKPQPTIPTAHTQNLTTNTAAIGKQTFNLLHTVVFLTVGLCIGYLFSTFLTKRKSTSSLLITHNEIGKSN